MTTIVIDQRLLEEAERYEEELVVGGMYRPEENLLQILVGSETFDMPAVGYIKTGKKPSRDAIQLTSGESGCYFMPLRPVPGKFKVEVIPVAQEAGSRNESVSSDEPLSTRHVLLVGAGSLGSGIGLQLAQAGVGNFTVLDRDRLTAPNLSRHAGDLRDLGREKAEVVSTLLRMRGAEAESLPRDLFAIPEDELRGQVDWADLVIVTTDSALANFRMNELVVDCQKSAVFAQAWERGSAGEILGYVPDGTGPCLCCAVGFRMHQGVEPERPAGDTEPYETPESANLQAEPGLAADLGLIISAASSYGLALLDPEGRRAAALLPPERRFLLLQSGNEPLEQYRGLHPSPFGAVFATVSHAEPCPVCGFGASENPA